MHTKKDALRSLILGIVDCYFKTGTVTDLRHRVVTTATADLRRQFSDLQDEVRSAETIDDMGLIATRARVLSVKQNFYMPREHVLLYELLTTIKCLHEFGVLETVDWTRIHCPSIA